jgi:phosphotransacetylase
MTDRFEPVLAKARGCGTLRMAIVAPTGAGSMQGAIDSLKLGLIDPLWVGPKQAVLATAEKLAYDIDESAIVEAANAHHAAQRACEMARDGEVQAIMKGSIHTDDLMHAVVSEKFLRTDRRMSHAFVMDVPLYERLMFIADGAINIAPNLKTLKDIVQNTVDLAHAMGLDEPNVAILSAIETVQDSVPSSVNAAAISKMAERGEIRGAVVDGPLAFDNAVSRQAAEIKGLRSAVAGHADMFIAPDLVSANILMKALDYLANGTNAGLVLGARIPIVLTSRADEPYERELSAALACIMAKEQALS